MKKLLLAVSALVCAATLGSSFGITKALEVKATEANRHQMHGGGMHNGQMHSDRTVKIPTGQPIPTVDLVVHPDAVRGRNLEFKVTNFKFAPERVNQASNAAEGHAHLYIDGEKITRIYGPWYYLDTLEPGQHEITVVLNANGHETLVHQDQPIQDTEVVQVSAAN